MAIIKPRKPAPPKKKKRKIGDWKKSFDKKKPQPKPLPQGPGKKNKKKPAAKAKGKTPNWRDSTYQKQESYLKKLLADFNAKQIRSKADLAVYYGNEERAAQGAVYEKDTVTKTPIKSKAPAKKSAVNDAISAMEKNKKKKSPTPPKSKGIPMRRPAPEPPKKKAKSKLARDSAPLKPKSKLARDSSPLKPTVKYKTTITKGKLLRAATAATKASEGLYHKELAEARLKDKSDITDDYAARGVLRSGLYAQKQGDYEKEYGKQVAETNRQKASRYAELDEENRDFLNQQELEKEQARLEAVRRRAAKTGKVA